MNVNDEDRIFMENLYIYKGLKQKKNLLRNTWIKFGHCWDWTNFWKNYKKLARWQDEAAALKAYTEYLLFSYFVIFIQKLDIIRKKCLVCLQIFSAAILRNMIKIGQHLTE